MRKPLIEDGHTLTVHRVVTLDGQSRPTPGERREGLTRWWRRNGQEAGSIRHRVEMRDVDRATLVLLYDLNGQPVRQSFELFGRPCRFGGLRWLGRCEETGRAFAKLHTCADGLFRPRHAIVAAYRSQDRVPATERLRDREVAILKRLGADDQSLRLPKPKWMRWPTYGRLLRELRAVRGAYGPSLAREFFVSTGIDLTDGEDPSITAGSRRRPALGAENRTAERPGNRARTGGTGIPASAVRLLRTGPDQ